MSRKFPLTLDEFQSIYSKVPRLCVDLVIRKQEGILMTLRQKDGWIDQWHLPGGTIYYRESIENAIKRVAQEELGTDIRVISLLGPIEYFSELTERGYGYSISFAYLCEIPSDSIITLDDHAKKYAFFSELPANTVMEQKQFLNQAK